MSCKAQALAIGLVLGIVISSCGTNEASETRRGGVSNKTAASATNVEPAETASKASGPKASEDLFKEDPKSDPSPIADIFRKNAAPPIGATVTFEGEGKDNFTLLGKRVQDKDWSNLSQEEVALCTEGAKAMVIFKSQAKGEDPNDAKKIPITQIKFSMDGPTIIEFDSFTATISCPDGLIPWQL